MTKMVEQAARAVQAYRGWDPEEDIAEKLRPGLSDDANAIQDLITDLKHLAEALGVLVDDYKAQRNYLAEAHRCMGCGMNQLEIEQEHAEEVRAFGADDDRVMPATECAGWWDRLGEAGPHEFDDIQAGQDDDAAQEFRRKLDGHE